MDLIDLRSDTVTRPTPEMLAEVVKAPVGDDVYGEDPTVVELEERLADMFGKESGLFVPTGVMANQLALKVQTQPGDEIVVGKRSHIFNYETGAPATLSGVQVHTVDDPEGRLSIEELESALRERVYYMPRTSVIAQENTHNKTSGTVTAINHLKEIFDWARQHEVAVHIDGARIWNALVAADCKAEEYRNVCDTISVCLSKGLGSPVGSVLLGPKALIHDAWRYRKMWGGGWRQAGVLAAAGLYALDNHMDRLEEDHVNAKRFHTLVSESEHIDAGTPPQSNIVVFRIQPDRLQAVVEDAKNAGILISAAFKGALRAVFHYDVSAEQTERAGSFLAGWNG